MAHEGSIAPLAWPLCSVAAWAGPWKWCKRCDRAKRVLNSRPWMAGHGTLFGTTQKEESVAITASEARRELFPLIEKVNDDRTAIEITSKRGNAVLMSLTEYESLQETAYLLRSPVNARRLLESLAQAQAGELVEHPLDTADE